MKTRDMIGLIRLFGLGRLFRMKARHNRSLPFIRGYATSSCLWTLLNIGLLDHIKKNGGVQLEEYAKQHSLDLNILEAICEYLECLKILKCNGSDRTYGLDTVGCDLMEEPRGSFDLTYGYEGIFHELEKLARQEILYKKDIDRRGKFIAKGSGELGRQLPFPVMQDMVRRHGFKKILDLGCGDAGFLEIMCAIPGVEGYGIDYDQTAIAYAEERLRNSKFAGRIHIRCADIFDIQEVAGLWEGVEVLTAVDVFHEYLWDGNEKIEDLLKKLKEHFRGAAMIVGEFCKQPHGRLRKNPTGFLEHHLFHRLTNQKILTADEWRDLFRTAGYEIVEEKVFDLIGHGYFLIS